MVRQVGTDSQPCKMQILHDDSQACARPDQVFYQRYRARTRLRNPGPRSNVGHQTYLRTSRVKHSEQGQPCPRSPHSIFLSRHQHQHFEIQPDCSARCVFRKRAVYFRILQRGLGGGGQHSCDAGRSSAAQISHLASDTYIIRTSTFPVVRMSAAALQNTISCFSQSAARCAFPEKYSAGEDRLPSTARIVSSSRAASIDPHRLTFYRAQSSSEDSRLWNVQQNSQSYERLSEQHVQPRCLS